MKKAWTCPCCERAYAKPGSCKDCDERLIQGEWRTRVVYRCPLCGFTSLKRGTCPTGTCEANGRALERLSSESGPAR